MQYFPFASDVLKFINVVCPQTLPGVLVGKWMSITCIFMLITMAGGVYLGSSFECIMPGHWTANEMEVVQNLCFRETHWFVPKPNTVYDLESIILDKNPEWPKIVYYPYIGIVLFVTALSFTLPRYLWIYATKKCDIQIERIFGLASVVNDIKRCDTVVRAEAVKEVSAEIEYINKMTNIAFIGCSFFEYTWSMADWVIQWVYLLFSLIQFDVYCRLFDHKRGIRWGYYIIRTFFLREIPEEDTWMFPEQVLCVSSRQKTSTMSGGGGRVDEVECALHHNTIAKWFFAILWVFMIFNIVVCFINVVYTFIDRAFNMKWFWSTLVRKVNRFQVRKNTLEAANIRVFKKRYMRNDAMLVLYLMYNDYPRVAMDVIEDMYLEWKKQRVGNNSGLEAIEEADGFTEEEYKLKIL